MTVLEESHLHALVELVRLAADQHRLAVRVRDHGHCRRAGPTHDGPVGHDGSGPQDDLRQVKGVIVSVGRQA